MRFQKMHWLVAFCPRRSTSVGCFLPPVVTALSFEAAYPLEKHAVTYRRNLRNSSLRKAGIREYGAVCLKQAGGEKDTKGMTQEKCNALFLSHPFILLYSPACKLRSVLS